MADEKSTALLPGEQQKIEDAHKALAADPHAPREVSVRVGIHIHNEYPKMLYSGAKNTTVANEAEEDAARANGYGDYQGPVAE